LELFFQDIVGCCLTQFIQYKKPTQVFNSCILTLFKAVQETCKHMAIILLKIKKSTMHKKMLKDTINIIVDALFKFSDKI